LDKKNNEKKAVDQNCGNAKDITNQNRAIFQQFLQKKLSILICNILCVLTFALFVHNLFSVFFFHALQIVRKMIQKYKTIKYGPDK